MKAIGLWQPWATLMAICTKKIETRSWRFIGTGPLAIQATKGFTKEARELCATEPFVSVLRAAGFTTWRDLPTGAIVCVVDVVRCETTTALLAKGVDANGQQNALLLAGKCIFQTFAWAVQLMAIRAVNSFRGCS